jgi:diguanylate cyclase (GGDEF)-like protein/PAS domain S-box-containing protein
VDENGILSLKSLKVAGLYAFFGFLWILFSDRLILLFSNDLEDLARIQTYKGWFFILITAILLYLLVRLVLRAQEKTAIALRKSEERLSATLGSIGDGVISTDSAGRVVSLNRVAEALTGWNTREASGRPITEIFSIINVQTRNMVENPAEQCLREGRSVDLANHTVLIRRDGTEYHIADSCAPIHDLSGAVIGAVLVFRDVTTEYRHRQQLRDKNERLASVLWGTGVGTWEWNIQTGETCFNERWAEMIGYSLAEISPVSIKSFEQFLHPDERQRIEETLERHFRGETDYYECEFRMRHQAGHWVWVLDRGKVVSWADNGQPLQMVGTHLDITDRKHAEETRRLSDERLQSVFRVAPAGIGVVRDRVFSEVNQRLCEMTGYTPEELIGQSSRMLYPSEEEHALVGRIKYDQIKATGTGAVETRWHRKDGTIREIWLASSPFNSEDLSQGVIFTALDITERKTAEKALKESERKLSSWMGNLPGMAYRCRNDRNWTMEFMSEGCHALTGYFPEDLKNCYSEIIHPDDREYMWQTVQTSLVEKKPFQLEFRIRTASDEERWVWEQGVGLFSEQGAVEALEGIIVDITERKRAEEALSESEARYRSLFENNHAVMLVLDPATGEIVDANPAAASWYGWSRDELCQKNIGDINKCLKPLELIAEMERAARQQAGPFLFQHQRADGSLRDVEVFSGPVQVAGRSLLYSIIHDITEKNRAEQALEKRMLALTRPLDDTTSLTFEDLFNLQDIQRLQDDFAHATGVAALMVSPDGTPITAPSNFCRLCQEVRRTAKGQANCCRSDAAIGQPSKQGPTVQRCLSAGLWDAGAAILIDGRHIANWLVGQVRDTTQTEAPVRAYAREIGADEEAMIEAFREIPVMSHEQFAQVAQALYTLANQLSLSAYQNVQQARFITEQKRNQAEIAFLAHHDQLTGLANRTLLTDHFELAVGHALRTGTQLVLCVLDLDGFKAINDSHGHPLGDLLLCEVAQRLTAAVRSSDTVCRIGGDEFVILFTDLPTSSAVTPLIQKTIACFKPRFNLKETFHSISASMGVALFPEDGDDFPTLFEHADAAMYFAKESGRNNVQFFHEEINQRVQHRLTIERELRQALLHDHLELYYQPIIYLPEMRIAGMEALVRWRHPQKGLIPPDQFIPVAEESNLIVSLGQWVLKEACRTMAAWRALELPALPVSVNVSARQLFENDFANFVEQTLIDCDLPPQQLELEVTENIFLESSDSVETVMNHLKNVGVGLSLDDFGTGYSSLSYLKRFRIEKLKIDRSFMEQVCHNPQDAILVKTIIRMAQSLGMQVVSEGVETAEQLAFLINQDCELAQGFFFSKPLPRGDMQELLGQPVTYDRGLTPSQENNSGLLI